MLRHIDCYECSITRITLTMGQHCIDQQDSSYKLSL
jgi:hypothetical protein